MIVKICGITREEDAIAAAAHGAHAIGFIFWEKSPRYIDPYAARRIVAALPPFVTPVGVFVNQDVAHVNAVAALARLGAVQLHGDEDPTYAALIARPVIRAVGADESFEVGSLDRWPDRTVILLDAHDPVARGGTGRTTDWSLAATAAKHRRIVLSGGLGPENIGRAIDRVKPFGIDVSSGVESAPGVKDHQLLRALFQNMKSHADIDTPARS